jgi:hypothetical protein
MHRASAYEVLETDQDSDDDGADGKSAGPGRRDSAPIGRFVGLSYCRC